MTDTYSDHGTWLSDAELHAIAAQDVNLADDASIAAEQSRRDAERITHLELDLEWTQRQRERAEAAEQFAEAAFQAAKRRADRAERDIREHVIEPMVAQACDDEDLAVRPEGDDLDSIVETLMDDYTGGVDIDQMDARVHVRNWWTER